MHKKPYTASLVTFSSQIKQVKPPLIVGGGHGGLLESVSLTCLHAHTWILMMFLNYCDDAACILTKDGWLLPQASDHWKDLN